MRVCVCWDMWKGLQCAKNQMGGKEGGHGCCRERSKGEGETKKGVNNEESTKRGKVKKERGVLRSGGSLNQILYK